MVNACHRGLWLLHPWVTTTVSQGNEPLVQATCKRVITRVLVAMMYLMLLSDDRTLDCLMFMVQVDDGLSGVWNLKMVLWLSEWGIELVLVDG